MSSLSVIILEDEKLTIMTLIILIIMSSTYFMQTLKVNMNHISTKPKIRRFLFLLCGNLRLGLYHIKPVILPLDLETLFSKKKKKGENLAQV